MAVKGCEKNAALRTAQELEREIADLELPLRNSFMVSEPNEELKKNPAAWVAYIKDAIDRAEHLLAEYKNLRDLFAKLEVSSNNAERRLPPYAKRFRIPGYE